MFVDNLDIF